MSTRVPLTQILFGPQGPRGPAGPPGADGSGGAVAGVVEHHLTDTTPTTILTYTPGSSKRHLTGIYYRITTATQMLKLTLSWTDATGAQSVDLMENGPYPIGSYSVPPVHIQAAQNTAITLVATAGFATTQISNASYGAALPQSTLNVLTTVGFPNSGTLTVQTGTSPATITYTGKTATTFTGCSGGSGTLPNLGTVTGTTIDSWVSVGISEV